VKKQEETARILITALKKSRDRGNFNSDVAIDVVFLQLNRPGAPGARLSRDARIRLRRALEQLAKPLVDDPVAPRALLAFAQGAADAAWSLAKEPRHPGQRIDESLDDMKKLAKAAIFAEATRARDQEDLVRRAVARAVREKKRERPGVAPVDVADGDPLRAVLHVPSRGRVVLPRNDVRNRIVGAAKNTAFGDALRKAARFGEEVVRPAIGEELWALGRPVGFSDKSEVRVLVEVVSSAHAQEIQMRSQELVFALRKIPGFERIAGIKVIVVSPKMLPVI
jgi:hypothetical protein